MSEDKSGKKSNTSSTAGRAAISRRRLLGSSSVIAASAVASTALPRPAASQTPSVLPPPQPPFQGKIERTVKDSTPDFPKSIEAPAGAPNILLILTDDVGFGATSTFGGPIQTPNFQRVADGGLRYNMYHTTALCSPTRAALITGRNHHSVASGVIRNRLPGLQFTGASECWFRRGSAQRKWLQHVVVRQNAQCAGLDVEPGRPV
jgi:hypothetical protein